MVRAEDGEESQATTGELTEFIEKAKMGEITNQDIPKFAKMFKVCRGDSFWVVPADVGGDCEALSCEVTFKRFRGTFTREKLHLEIAAHPAQWRHAERPFFVTTLSGKIPRHLALARATEIENLVPVDCVWLCACISLGQSMPLK